MLSILKRLFGYNSTPSVAQQQSQATPQHAQTVNDKQESIFAKTVACLTLDREEEVPMNKWYRRSHWQSEHFLKMETSWDTDWKVFETEEEVVGVTFDSRTINFLRLWGG
jgi:hypothetical protein